MKLIFIFINRLFVAGIIMEFKKTIKKSQSVYFYSQALNAVRRV